MNRIDEMINFGLVYITFGAVICLVYRLFNKENNKLQFIDILICLILVIISAIRINTGSDFYSYFVRYNTSTTVYQDFPSIFSGSNSPFFDLISYFLKSIGFCEFGIFQFSAIIFYLPLIFFLRKTSKKPYLGLFVFIFSSFFLITNNILKHTFAMMILFLSYNKFLRNGKMVKFLICSGLAALFHPTVLVASLVLIVSKRIKPTFKKLLVFELVAVFVLLFANVFFAILKRIVGIEYLPYIDDGYNTMLKQTICVFGYVVFYNIITCYLIKNKKKISENNPDNERLISATIIAIALSIVSMAAWPLNRFPIYIYFFSMQLVPLVIENETRRNKIFLISLYVIWCLFVVITSGDNEYYKYDTYLNGDTHVMRPREYVKLTGLD